MKKSLWGKIKGIVLQYKNLKLFLCILISILLFLGIVGCAKIQELINIEILSRNKPQLLDESAYQHYKDEVAESDKIIKGLETIEMRVQPYILSEEEISANGDNGSYYQTSDGIGILLNFYSKNGRQIYFSDIPVIASVEIFVEEPYGIDVKISEEYLGFKAFFYINRTMAANEMVANNFIRIPYNDMDRKPGKFNQYGIVRVQVETPEQGVFKVADEKARLFISLD